MAEQQKFSLVLQTPAINKLITNTLGDKEKARQFVAEISTVVSNNPVLQSCQPNSIISAGLLAQSVNLSLAPTLGFCYVVPYGNKAQFLISWKGLVQLALRTGEYLRIGVREVHKGEHIGQDKFGEDEFKFDHKYDKEEVVGYFAYFELKNGYSHQIYWTKEQCEEHGKRYSVAYQKNAKAMNRWRDDFSGMSMKTVLKQLISKWGIMSTEMQKVIINDQTSINENGSISYDDNPMFKIEDNGVTNIVVPDIPAGEETGEVKEEKEVKPEDFMN